MLMTQKKYRGRVKKMSDAKTEQDRVCKCVIDYDNEQWPDGDCLICGGTGANPKPGGVCECVTVHGADCDSEIADPSCVFCEGTGVNPEGGTQ